MSSSCDGSYPVAASTTPNRRRHTEPLGAVPNRCEQVDLRQPVTWADQQHVVPMRHIMHKLFRWNELRS